MKYVPKGGEPNEVLAWKLKNRTAPQNLIFENLPKAPVRLALLKKQGWICAYTMLRLDGEFDCHIEHMVPRSISPIAQIDFDNLLACFPSGTSARAEFGAHYKGSKNVSIANFVFPTDSSCESRFEFRQDGSVIGRDDVAARTILVLNLNHSDLIKRRQDVFRQLGLTSRPMNPGRPRPKLATIAKAAAIAAQIMRPDGTGRFEIFCIAIAQVAMEYAERMRRTAGLREHANLA